MYKSGVSGRRKWKERLYGSTKGYYVNSYHFNLETLSLGSKMI